MEAHPSYKEEYLSEHKYHCDYLNYALQLRKKSKKEMLSKKRIANHDIDKQPVMASELELKYPQYKCMSRSEIFRQSIEVLSNPISSTKDKVTVLQLIYKRMDNLDESDITLFIESSLISFLLKGCQSDDDEEIHFSLICLLNSLYYEKSTKILDYLIKENITSVIKARLCNTKVSIRETLVYICYNISQYSQAFKMQCLTCGITERLITALYDKGNSSFIEKLIETISAMLFNVSGVPSSLAKEFVMLCVELLKSLEIEAKTHLLFAMSYILDSNDIRFKEIISTELINTLLEIITKDQTVFLLPTIRSIGNLCSDNSDNTVTNLFIEHGVITVLRNLLTQHPDGIISETLWALSNICLGSNHNIDRMLSEGVIKDSLDLAFSNITRIEEESIWLVCNAVTQSNGDQIKAIFKLGIIDMYKTKLGVCTSNCVITLIILDSLAKIASISKTYGFFQDVATELHACGLVEKLGFMIPNHPNEKITKLCIQILEDIEFEDKFSTDKIMDEFEVPFGDIEYK